MNIELIHDGKNELNCGKKASNRNGRRMGNSAQVNTKADDDGLWDTTNHQTATEATGEMTMPVTEIHPLGLSLVSLAFGIWRKICLPAIASLIDLKHQLLV